MMPAIILEQFWATRFAVKLKDVGYFLGLVTVVYVNAEKTVDGGKPG